MSRNPWRRAHGLATWTWLYVLWMFLPVGIAVVFSFNGGRSRSVWQGFSLRWWTEEPNASLLHDETLHLALRNSLVLAVLTMLIATPLGVALAVGLARWKARVAKGANWLMLVPLVTPEIVMGASLLLVCSNLYTGVPLGRPAQLLGHVTFSMSYVVVVSRGRLLSIGKDYEEAARDLGASQIQALRMVLLPLLAPAIFASFVIVFAMSIDDFVISSFLSSGAGSETVPVRIYSAVRTSSTPALNALATFLVFSSLLALTLGATVMSLYRRRQGGGESGDSVLSEFASLEL
ncbi:MAG: ABC transporter permease [Acidimicrobiales bacterium]|nr:ABC transporter permease [Acidimicrobiales bacterium]